jgi:hypothetical protein
MGLDERTLRRVCAALATLALNRQLGEDRSSWLARLDLEKAFAVDL